MPTIGEVLAEELAKAGVTRVYGLPGGENVEVLEAMRKQGIEFVLVKNESSAVYMADVEGRLRGTIGVALTTLGPGATNAFVGVAHAYLERSRVLLITAQTDPHLIGTHTHQVIDLQAIFSAVTQYTAEIETHNAGAIIAHAMAVLGVGRGSPVHLGVNNRVAVQVIDALEKSPKRPSKVVEDEGLLGVKEVLKGAKRVAIVVGLGLEGDRPYDALRTLAEKLGAVVIDTPKSKGALPASHPLFGGTIGLTRTDPAYAILDEADCIFAVGFDVVELVKPWDQKQPLIWIANWENQDPRIPAVVEFIGEINGVLDALAETLDFVSEADWGERRVRQFRDELAKVTLPEAQAGRILPQTVLQILREHTPDDVIITTDVGSHKIFTALNWEAETPNRYFVSNGLSAMGFGVTGAIAAAMVTGQLTVCITGDAGLAMVMGELALMVQYDLPVIVMVMNDAALDLIRAAQKRSGKTVFGTEFTNPDYELIAKAYGLSYGRATSEAECDAVVKQAVEAKKPCLIEVMLDPVSYPTTVKG